MSTAASKQGFVYEGLTTATLQLDTQRAFGLNGGLFNVSALEIHGGNLSATNLYTLQTASGIEADPAFRFWEIWYQQKFGDCDRRQDRPAEPRQRIHGQPERRLFLQHDVRLADAAFGRSARRRPGLSALGAGRARARPSQRHASPCSPASSTAARTTTTTAIRRRTIPSALSFPLNGGVLAIAELQFAYPGSGTLVKANEDDPLARTYKIGVWYNSESFADLRYNNLGQPLANPANSQTPADASGQLRVLCDRSIRWSGAPRTPTATSTFSCVRCSRRCRIATSSTSASTAA